MIHRHLIAAFWLLVSLVTFASDNNEPLPVHSDWGGEFSLTDQYGIEMSLSDFAGKVIVLSFGYTHCPDVCPTTMLMMKKLMQPLGENAEKVQVVFITLDPQRDTAERLQAYMTYFSPAFVGLTGSTEQINTVAKAYGTRFEIEPSADPEKPEEYSIAHTAIIYLLDQQGRIRLFYPLKTPPEQIKGDIEKLLIN